MHGFKGTYVTNRVKILLHETFYERNSRARYLGNLSLLDNKRLAKTLSMVASIIQQWHRPLSRLSGRGSQPATASHTGNVELEQPDIPDGKHFLLEYFADLGIFWQYRFGVAQPQQLLDDGLEPLPS